MGFESVRIYTNSRSCEKCVLRRTRSDSSVPHACNLINRRQSVEESQPIQPLRSSIPPSAAGSD